MFVTRRNTESPKMNRAALLFDLLDAPSLASQSDQLEMIEQFIERVSQDRAD